MSVLPAEVHTALAQLLQGLQSTDNTVRTAAEEQLNTEWVNQRPDMLLMGLTEQMRSSPEEGVSLDILKTRWDIRN
jgi:importin-5